MTRFTIAPKPSRQQRVVIAPEIFMPNELFNSFMTGPDERAVLENLVDVLYLKR